MVAAPIFGYLGDRFNRKVILSCGIFFWSAVTFSSSFIPQQVRPAHYHLGPCSSCPHVLAPRRWLTCVSLSLGPWQCPPSAGH